MEPAEVYEYTYNALGYITNVKKNGTTISTYSYDALGQLVGETVNNQIYIYSYDKSGNITQKLVFTGDIGNLTDTINYTYSTSAWGDLLTNYDGTAITYDSIGNPTKWRNSTNLTWDGRTLTSQTLTNGNSITYKYNSDGIRTQKRVFDDVASAYITHDYVLDGTKILSETVTDNAYYNNYTLYYVYDADGSITGLHYSNQPYYFQKNIQGDILRILDRTGTAVVEYTYDAWGNIISVTGSMANTLGQYNPFRYRGYYYDSETDLYYLNSRYYDPQVGRFINADVYISTGEGIRGYNMFAYCLNNPVTRTDISGADSFSVTEGDDDNPMDDLGASNLGVGGGSGGTVNGGGTVSTTTSSTTSGSGNTPPPSFNGGGSSFIGGSSSVDPSDEQQEKENKNGLHIQNSSNSKPFLPDDYYANKKAPPNSTPNSKYENYKYNSYTGQYEYSVAYYDYIGRQFLRIDYTNHGRSDHGCPHVHFRFYNNANIDGHKVRLD